MSSQKRTKKNIVGTFWADPAKYIFHLVLICWPLTATCVRSPFRVQLPCRELGVRGYGRASDRQLIGICAWMLLAMRHALIHPSPSHATPAVDNITRRRVVKALSNQTRPPAPRGGQRVFIAVLLTQQRARRLELGRRLLQASFITPTRYTLLEDTTPDDEIVLKSCESRLVPKNLPPAPITTYFARHSTHRNAQSNRSSAQPRQCALSFGV